MAIPSIFKQSHKLIVHSKSIKKHTFPKSTKPCHRGGDKASLIVFGGRIYFLRQQRFLAAGWAAHASALGARVRTLRSQDQSQRLRDVKQAARRSTLA